MTFSSFSRQFSAVFLYRRSNSCGDKHHYRVSNHSGLIFAWHWANSIVLKRAQMKLIEWWQQAGARTAWLSSDLRAELSGDTEVSIDALAPDLREIASALLLCQKTDYSHALERLNAHAFTD